MTGPWVLAFGAVVVSQLLLVLFVIGLGKRLLSALGRVEAVLPQPEDLPQIRPTQLDVNEPAPPLPADNLAALTADRGLLLLFIEHGCQPCQLLAADLRHSRLNEGDCRLAAVVDDFREFPQLPSNWATITDSDRSIAAAWRVTGTPVAFFIDDQHVIRAIGVPNSVGDLQRLLRQGANESPQRRLDILSASTLEARHS